jgi:hypothetical protein
VARFAREPEEFTFLYIESARFKVDFFPEVVLLITPDAVFAHCIRWAESRG